MSKVIEKRQQKNKEALLKKFEKYPIIQAVCERTGIARSTYYRWRKEDKKFRKESDKAIQKGIALVNDLAESQLIASIKDRHMTAIIFWLKNRHKNYKEKVDIKAEIKNKDKKITPEQEIIIKKALSLVAFQNEQDKKHENKKTKRSTEKNNRRQKGQN